jgi:hypothetical protein
MSPHRISYWKTTLVGLGAFLFALALAVYWQVTGEIRLPSTGWNLTRSVFFYWPLVTLLMVVSLFCLLLTVAGFICLYGDAREKKES